MKKFLQFSLGAFLLLAGISLVIASVQPAYGERSTISHAAPDAAALKIVYVNIDTVNNQYKAYLNLADSANHALAITMESYQKHAAELQERYNTLQLRVNMGAISVDAAAKEEAAINEGLDKLRIQETQLATLESEAMKKNDSISMLVALFFDEYAKKNGIDYVLMYGTGMPIIYANDALDVTAEAVKQLNAEYDQSNPSPPVKQQK